MYAVGLIVFFFCIFFLRGHLSRKSRYFVDEPNIATINCHDRTDARRSLMKKTRQYLSECLKCTLPARTFAVNSLFEDNANNLSLSLSLSLYSKVYIHKINSPYLKIWDFVMQWIPIESH